MPRSRHTHKNQPPSTYESHFEHTALFDIQQSIAELKFLRKEIMK